MLLIKKTMPYIRHIVIILVTAIFVALGSYYLLGVKFSITLLILGLMSLMMAYLDFSKKHPGSQMQIAIGRSPVNSNTTAVLNTDVVLDEQEANINIEKRPVERRGERINSLFRHTALEYGVAGIIIMISAFNIYLSTSVEDGMTNAIGDPSGYGIEHLPWHMTIDSFYKETGYTKQDTSSITEGVKEVEREGMYSLPYHNSQFDLISRFENDQLIEVGYILTDKSSAILSVSNQLYKSFDKELPEPIEGSVEMLLELPKTNNSFKSVSWQASDGSSLTISFKKVRPNYILEVIAAAPN